MSLRLVAVRLVMAAQALLPMLPNQMASAQTGWSVAQTPNSGDGVYFYDPDRQRAIFITGSATYEVDGNTSGAWQVVALASPPYSSSFSGGGYDAVRRRVVYNDGLNTWEWDGTTWRVVAPFPPIWSFMSFVTHSGRGRVLAFGGPDYWNSNDLYEWSGGGWNLLATTNRPPRPGNSSNSRLYLRAAYDERRDKLVVFGSADMDWTTSRLSNFQPDLWEWDASNGWVQRNVQGTVDRGLCLFFDSQRGVVTKGQGRPIQMAEWDGGSAWQSIQPSAQLPPTLAFYECGAYHDVRGLLYTGLSDSVALTVSPWAYGTINPARFEDAGSGCAGTLGEPALRLTHNWTRAWFGRSLSVDLTNLPMSAGIVALGWSDQQHGSTPLPLDLTPFGMPGCSARVAPDSVYFVAGTNQTATLSLPVPANPALLGGVFFQQGYAFDPAANPLGLSTSGSIRLTIGSL